MPRICSTACAGWLGGSAASACHCRAQPWGFADAFSLLISATVIFTPISRMVHASVGQARRQSKIGHTSAVALCTHCVAYQV